MTTLWLYETVPIKMLWPSLRHAVISGYLRIYRLNLFRRQKIWLCKKQMHRKYAVKILMHATFQKRHEFDHIIAVLIIEVVHSCLQFSLSFNMHYEHMKHNY